MNQNDQMRTTVDRLLGEIICLEGAVLYKDPWPELELRVRDMKKIAEQALNHTPDTGEMVDHIGDANKMVRLTDEFLIETYLLCKAEWKATNKRQRERIAVMFGKAVMDAMIARTGGSND
ncbi:MAG: hypothetical protein U1D69_12840 [Polynucleobacter sp.]|uniref:hypothetical protein n=1 Tax=Limnobacter sp. TaxID=2003368 RepID=UPI00273399DC|nr:hypothetical protein [Limnobacter sp.]MDP3273402.1 hypothetical protein [Limnobacter sp.]MDZ4057819.1 hypothetical protein [Polynucleobacter sp.]